MRWNVLQPKPVKAVLDGTEELQVYDPLRKEWFHQIVQDIANLSSSYSDILEIPTAETDTDLVLKPDGVGGVEWGVVGGSFTLTDGEGTTANGTAVDLGGSFINEISILGTGEDASFILGLTDSDSDSSSRFSSSAGSMTMTSFDGENYPGVGVERTLVTAGQTSVSLQYYDGSDVKLISLSGAAGMRVRDDSDLTGLYYFADYSTNFTDRSLVDKAYVDSVAGTPGIDDVLAIAQTLTTDREINGAVDLSLGGSTALASFNVYTTSDFQLGIENGDDSANIAQFIETGEIANTLTCSTTNKTVTVDLFGQEAGSNSYAAISVDNGTTAREIRITESDITATDEIKYTSDHSATFVDRSLIDKEYSDSYFVAALADSAPTAAQIIGVLGTAASRGAGYKAVIKDSTGSTNVYFISCDGTSYYYVEAVAAV